MGTVTLLNPHIHCIMEILKGQTLIKKDGSSHPADSALAGKPIVMIYFSAHWCPPCKAFTPVLKDFYEEVQDDVELIFVSSDRSHDDMISYMKESHGTLITKEGRNAVTSQGPAVVQQWKR